MNTTEGKPYKRDFEILFLAYDTDIGAPARKNADGKYEPIDASVVCNENVSVFFAPAGMDVKRSIYHSVNVKVYEAFEGWKACWDEVSLYLYQSNWRDVFSHYDALSCMQEFYQYLATGNIKFVHNAGAGYNSVSTRFETFTSYISSVLTKNVNADADCEFLGVTSGGSLWSNLEDSLFNDWEKGSSGDSWWGNLFPW